MGTGNVGNVGLEAGAGGRAPAGSLECEDPEPQVGGFVRCGNGRLHRPEPGDCPFSVPRPDPVIDNSGGAPSECYDADCTHLGHQGFCSTYPYCELPAFADSVGCRFGCVGDAACAVGQLCLCGSLIERFGPEIPTGVCIDVGCRTDAECGDGLLCVSYFEHEELKFACQTPDDDCDCGDDCSPPAPGRPWRCNGDSGQCGGP